MRRIITHCLYIIVSSLFSVCLRDGDLFLHHFNLDCNFKGIFNCSSVSEDCWVKFLCSQVESSSSDSKTLYSAKGCNYLQTWNFEKQNQHLKKKMSKATPHFMDEDAKAQGTSCGSSLCYSRDPGLLHWSHSKSGQGATATHSQHRSYGFGFCTFTFLRKVHKNMVCVQQIHCSRLRPQ